MKSINQFEKQMREFENYVKKAFQDDTIIDIKPDYQSIYGPIIEFKINIFNKLKLLYEEHLD